tara:strand:- start:3 stop:227 length:225 start_codon:yes stop_codon:yes gene_type:complete
MKLFVNPLLSLSAPLLICIALVGFIPRGANNRLQSLPAFIVGTGLIISGALARSYRRKQLLLALKKSNDHHRLD